MNKIAPILIFLVSITLHGFAQNSVRGVVTSAEDGISIPGVTISIKGTTTGTITDIDGNYSLNVSESDVLVFRFVGFEPREIEVGSQAVINVSLELSISALDEVVVVAYGEVRKRDLTGSVSTIKGDDILRTSSTSLDQALQGKAAGVQVTQVSGRPGGETSIRIRGSSSITAGNEPLYVVDGMLISSNNADLNVGGARGAAINAMSVINPSDIESINVLKDASATALYGSRGANGVILITTKRGTAGRTRISLNSYYGVQTVPSTLDLLNGEEFAHYINDLNKEVGLPSDVRYLIPENFGKGTDWQDAVFREAPMQSHQVTVSGGDKNTSFSVGGSYFKQDGIIINSDYERVTFRTALDRNVRDKLKIGSSINLSHITSEGVLTGALSPGTGVLLPGSISSAVLFPPTLPVLDPDVDGGYTFEDDRNRNLANPVADALETDNISANSRVIASLNAELKLIQSLSMKVNLGIDAFSSKDNRFVPNYLKRTEPNHGEASIGTVDGMTWLSEFTLNYNKTISDHKFDVLGGFSMQGFNAERLFVFTLDYADNRIGYHNLRAGLNPQAPASGEAKWGMIGYLGRVNYNYKSKYLATFTGRVDGSSRFGEDSKYGFFPSMALAWNILDEPFMNQFTVIDQFKLRMSIGVIGNADIASYASLPTVGPFGEGTFDNDEAYQGVAPYRLPNPDLRWERTGQFNAGLDIAFFEAKLLVTADYYVQNTSDLLLDRPVPRTSGFSSFYDNIGKLQNKGVELTLDGSILENESFSWGATFNISSNKNEIVGLIDKDFIPIEGVLHVPFGWSIYKVGQPVNSFYGLVSEGIFQTDEEAQNSALIVGQDAVAGERKYQDRNGRDQEGKLTGQPDGVINADDRTMIGNAHPNFTWNLSNNLKYKGFDFSIFIQASHGNDVINAYRFELETLTGETNVFSDAYHKRWTSENPSNKYRKLDPSDRTAFSDAQVEDGSFIRIRNISLGYSLPASLLSRMNMSKFRVYVSGTNLATFTKYTGYDPEVNAFGQNQRYLGIDYGGYPLSRTFLAGVQIGI